MDKTDIETKCCLICGWEYPPDVMYKGVCEDCQERIEEANRQEGTRRVRGNEEEWGRGNRRR